ncbi:MAG TPA: alkaline phosphatase family protein, partial [Polyangia bacterium]
PVHAPDLSHLDDLRDLLASGAPFDLLVVHFVGPDHASHRYRVTSPEFRNYTRWMDPKLDKLLGALVATGTTILVTSDHGMSDSGQHGGDEPTARKTPYLLQGPGIKVGPGPRLNQADLPATLAALLGLPVPPFGEGRVAHELLATSPETKLALMRANLNQAQAYLRGYQKKYGNVPRSLLDGAPDLERIASQQGADSALARGDAYLAAYHDQRRSVGKSVGRTWAWLVTILVFAVFVLLPDLRFPLPRGSLVAASVALLLSGASWATTATLWPSVVSALVASLWLGCGILVARRPSLHGTLTRVASGLVTGGLVTGLLALAHLGFKRQFRSETMLPGVSDSHIRVAGYLVVILAGVLYVHWKRPRASPAPASPWVRQAWMGLAIIGLFVMMLPGGKLLLLVSPSLGLGILWMLRLARIGETNPRLRLMALLESEWFLFLATLAWVCLETWFVAIAPLVDQGRGVLGWTLNRLPWLLAPALVYQQLLLGKKPPYTTKALSFLSVLMTLPPLLLAHHTTEHSNLLVWLALCAMLFAAVNLRSPVAKYQLGAATYALTSLFGSASYSLLCFVMVGTYWAFVLAPPRSGKSVSSPSGEDDKPSIA